jgi:glycolate oxidase
MRKPRWHELLPRLKQLLPAGEVHFEKDVCHEHAGDKWFASHLPDVVVLPRSTESVAALLRFASHHRIPVTPRAAGHGYVGGCVPMRGGIALSIARLNRIKEINHRDFVAVVQPGVITQELQEAVEKKGLYYPPDPASRADCFIGGNIATNAGGPRCLKYGVTRDYVMGLEVVLACGAVVHLGGRTHKNKTGFDLHRLFVGSEGLLGVITEATLKLIPRPPYRANVAVGFDSMKVAVRTLAAIFRAGLLPCALELADEFTLAAAHKQTGSKRLLGCRAMLIVELDGQKISVGSEMAELQKIICQQNPLFTQVGLGAEKCEEIWGLRRQFSSALKATGLKKLNEDIVVPRGRLEDLFKFTARLQKKIDLPIACFGHAGDGNIHVNIMLDMEDPGAVKRGEQGLNELFKQVLAWDGSITGEHGIGLAKKKWWPDAVSPEVQVMHQRVKKALDPHGILNPGKFV